LTSGDAAVVLGTAQSKPRWKMSNLLMGLGVIYCTVFVTVAVWIGLMLYSRRSGRQGWGEHHRNRLRRELEEVVHR